MEQDDANFAFIDTLADFNDMLAHLESQPEVAIDVENHSVSSAIT